MENQNCKNNKCYSGKSCQSTYEHELRTILHACKEGCHLTAFAGMQTITPCEKHLKEFEFGLYDKTGCIFEFRDKGQYENMFRLFPKSVKQIIERNL